MHKKCWLVIALLMVWSIVVAVAQDAPKMPVVQSNVSMNEFPELNYAVTGPAFSLPRLWKFYDGDKPEFSGIDFDDSGWQTVEVGQEKLGSKWRWYRVSFDLPQNLNGKNLLLDLGRISVYDEVFLNSANIGHFGNKPPHFTTGASHVWRKYPVDAKYFRPGKNVLAVRVYLGYRGGLYEGKYTLQALQDGAVIGKLGWKADDVHALDKRLTESLHLNTFAPDSTVLVIPRLTQLFGDSRNGQMTVKITDSEKHSIEEFAAGLPVQTGKWTSTVFQFCAPQAMGKYECQLTYSIGGNVRWNLRKTFEVAPPATIEFKLPVDASLASFGDKPLPVEISKFAMGHYGPRERNEEKVLFDDLEQTDARGSLTYAAQFMKSLGAPRLLLSGVRPVPVDANKLEKFHRVAGYVYDGLKDAWIYGFVRPNRAGKISDLSVKSTSWARRTYHYSYENNIQMDFSISAISPAWVATSNVQKMRVFEGIQKHGIGLPTHLAYESKGQIKIVDAKKGIRGSDMSANWVLAWFNGGEGWEGFDTPYLFVLQKRPELVQCYADTALFFSAPDGAPVGTIQGMPLYGVTLLRTDQTAAWSKVLPQDVTERCRYWSRVLTNAPDQVQRTAQVDYQNDQLTVKDEFSYLDIRDDWNTKGLKIAPASPVLALAAHSGRMSIAFDKPLEDAHLATLQGPFLVAANAEQMVFRIKGMLHYIREVRDVKKPDDAVSQQVQQELNQIVQKGLEAELAKHPWASTYKRNEIMPGLQQRSYVNLLLTLPYLQPALRGVVEKDIRVETEKYFLYGGVPGPELAPKLLPALREIPAITVVTNPVTGLKLGVSSSSNKYGIDQPFWTSTNTYMAWLYAEMFGRQDWIKQNYATLQHYFNNERNSHDWDICASWDSFSGLRVGNGLQEGSGKYAGDVAMARLAYAQGDVETSHQAAYYAVMEATAMLGQVSATDYLKARRPWPATNTEVDDIMFAMELRPHYYAEFNEFKGLSQAVILPHSLLNSTGSYILTPTPETMRLYQEVWPQFTDDFYDPKYDAILGNDRRLDTRTSMDVFVYMISHYPQSKDALFEIRRKLDLEWWDKLPDYRGYLDSRGEIGYRDLW